MNITNFEGDFFDRVILFAQWLEYQKITLSPDQYLSGWLETRKISQTYSKYI